jgi:hypothetical protein
MPSNKTRHPMAAAHAPCVFDDARMFGFPTDEEPQLMRWEDDGGRGNDISAKPSPPLNLIPVEDHDQYALLWDLADEVAGKDRNSVERCWLRIMDAFWSGDLPALFIFSDPKDIFAPGRTLIKLDRNTLATHLLERSDAITDADFAALRDWTLANYQRQPEPFGSYFASNPRFGLAARRDDFGRWRAQRELPSSPARPERQKEAHIPISGDEAAATKALAAHLRKWPSLKRAAAKAWCVEAGFELTERGFQNRIWPRAREQAGLPAKAPPGRARKSPR